MIYIIVLHVRMLCLRYSYYFISYIFIFSSDG